MAVPRWKCALPWLSNSDHETTAADVEQMKKFFEDNPRQLKKKDSHGCLPLHCAALYQRGEHSVEAVRTLLEAFPHGKEEKANRGSLPLHLAAAGQKGDNGVEVVKMLLTAYPMAAQHKTDDGSLPLHVAAERQKSEHGVAVVEMLLTAYPMAAQHKTNGGYLPLHFAAERQKGEHGIAVLKMLLAAYPMAVQDKTNRGHLPLHLAAERQKGEHGIAVLKMLLTAYPMAVQDKDILGYLPLHIAATWQKEEHGLDVVKMLLTAYPLAAQHKTNDGSLPFDFAQTFNSTMHDIVALLKKAAQGQWQPAAGDVAARKLVSAYNLLDAGADVVNATIPAHKLTVEQVEALCRRARIIVDQRSINSGDPLATLAAAASTLASEDRLSPSAASLLQAAPLLREVITAVHAPHTPLPLIDHVQALCTAAEDAASRLRACHGALTAHISSQPPPKAVNTALVEARNVALAAAQASSSALGQALLENDLATFATASEAAARELNAFLRRVMVTTGTEPDSQADKDDLRSTSSPGSAAAPDALQVAVVQLETFACDTAKAIEHLAGLSPVTLASLGEKDTQATRTTLKTMQEITRSVLLATNDGSLQHYLAFGAPWRLACSALAARCAVLKTEAEVVGGLVSTARQLDENNAAWTAAFAERDSKLAAFKRAHRMLGYARRAFLQAKLDAEPAHGSDDSSDDEDDASATAAAKACEGEPPAKRACRRAFVERDAAANDLYAFALAYCPEVVVHQRKRLMPGGLPTVVSQRSRSDYDNVGPLERAGKGRHTLLSATFEGTRCVLKVVPLLKSSALAREADILKQVKHPNIVELLAIFVENEVAYLHMAHASHGDLEHFLTVEAASTAASGLATEIAPALAPYQLQRMGRQLCEAVAYLAERSIVHCDIKPANVFVDGDCNNDSLRVVLGDFDVSHTATGRTTTLTRAVSGVATHYTPGYAPPEVLFASPGQPPRVSPAIDVYGLGCVIFAMHMHPRKLPEPASVNQTVASNSALFSIEAVVGVATPAVSAWAACVPREVVQAATCADPRARSSARELLHTRYMLDASGSFAHVAIQRPAYWLHQTHTGSWLEEEPAEVCVAVERALNATAEPSTHGVGLDSHGERFQRFKVTRVRRLEHTVVWSAYAAQRRHLADTLLAEGYAAPSSIEGVATEGQLLYPLEGGSLDTAAREVFLFHGSTKPASIANSGFDVRYAFAGAGAGAMFGSGLYFAESASKADQYVGRDGTRPLTMVVARVLLGRTAQVSAPRRNWPFLPKVAEKSSVEVPVYYDSIVADMRPQGMRFREVVVGEGSRAYPELFVEYERL